MRNGDGAFEFFYYAGVAFLALLSVVLYKVPANVAGKDAASIAKGR